MNLFDQLTGAKQYKDSLGKFSFQYKVNVRRNFRRRNTQNTFGKLVHFESDFQIPDDYDGPEIGQDAITPSNIIDVEKWFCQGKLLHRKYVYRILEKTEAFFRHNSPSLVDIRVPKDGVINICGDIHGQLFDMLKIFKIKGPPSATNLYLFNGDIVDKGQSSIECILLLFLLKLAFPNWVYLNRGNHESALVNTKHGFAHEIKKKYDDFFMFEFFGEIFRWLPVAHLVDNRILVVHGGLSGSRTVKLQDIRAIKRPVEPHTEKLVGELLWSDPMSNYGTQASSRGIGIFFGPDVTKRFLENNDLLCVVRSHSEIKEGCGLSHEGCYTVYSAPNKAKDILGGIMEFKGKHLVKDGIVFTACNEEELKKFQRADQSCLV